ncbi:nuclear mRNA splicing factor-associated protein [Cladochytrium replicatum]|nr:nuclear mRNA splicing factor-associated protein [Cladochytrium replicatum]
MDTGNTGNRTFNEERGKWVRTGEDNIQYEWDEEKQAWFPMYDEELISKQQSIYGGNEPEPVAPPSNDFGNVKKRKRPPKEEAPKEPKKPVNSSIYVTGLPLDVTIDEVKEAFGKFGLIMEGLDGIPRIKLYKDSNGSFKGDALVTYFKEESVQLAISLMDDTQFRFGDSAKLHVSKAVFQPKEKPPNEQTTEAKPKLSYEEKKKLKKTKQMMEKKLDWFETTSGKKAERYNKIVILKNMFSLKHIEEDPVQLLEIKDDVRTECEKLGEVTNVKLFEKSEEGVISVRFKEPERAIACVELMNGRFFGGQKIVAYIFDGKERFDNATKAEIEEDENERLEKFAKWLETDESSR